MSSLFPLYLHYISPGAYKSLFYLQYVSFSTFLPPNFASSQLYPVFFLSISSPAICLTLTPLTLPLANQFVYPLHLQILADTSVLWATAVGKETTFRSFSLFIIWLIQLLLHAAVRQILITAKLIIFSNEHPVCNMSPQW